MSEIPTPKEYGDICPFPDEIFQQKMKELVAEDGFKHAVMWVMPDIDFEGFCHNLTQITTKKDFQEKVMFGFLQMLAAKTTDGITHDGTDLVDSANAYTMITNHRDIVLDTCFLNLSLLTDGKRTTEVAIGSNLLIYKWIEDLVRLNKSFIVKRDLSIRQALDAAEQLSGYIHFAVAQKNESVWIAQRQGRAKDSSDTTQESLIKMLSLKGGKTPLENLKELHIMPVAISYELDPNDYLKAREFLLKSKDPNFKKTQRDDLFSMETGLLQNKGHVHFQFTHDINDELEGVEKLDKQEQLLKICEIIDYHIHSSFRIYPCNYIAYGERFATDRFADRYTAEERDKFERYLQSQLAKVQKEVDFELSAEDYAFMREKIIVMYSNPLVNKLKAIGEL